MHSNKFTEQRINEQKLRKMLDSASDLFCTIDEDRKFEVVCNADETLLGYKPEEIIAKSFLDVIHPDQREKIKESINRIKSGEIVGDLESNCVKKDGSYIPFMWSIKWNPEDKLFYAVGRDISQLIETRQRALENERMMLEAQKLTKMGSWSLDVKTDKLVWSEPLHSIFETDAESFKLTKESFVNLLDEDYRKLLLENSKSARETGAPFKIQYSFTGKSGQKKYIEEFGYSEVDENGEVVKIFGTAQDITERQHVEMLLQASEKRFKALVENSSDAVAIIGVDGNAKYVSPSITHILGYSEEESMQLNLFEIVHPEDIPTMTLKLNEVLAKPGIPMKGQSGRVRHKDGSWRWIDATLTNMLHEPAINGIIDNFRDITEQIEKDREILRSEKRLKSLVENSSDAIAILNQNFDPIYVSQSITLVLGYTEKEALSIKLADVIHPNDIRNFELNLQQVLENPAVPIKGLTNRVKDKEGKWRWIETSVNNMMDDPAIGGIIFNFRDITEQIEKDRKLLRSEQRYKAMVQEGSDMTSILDMNAVFQYISPNYPVLLGYTEEDLIGKSGFLHFHPDDVETIQKEFERLMTERRVKSSPYRFKRKDGTWCWLQSVGTNLLDEEVISGIVINTVDVTDLINAQNVLQKSNERYHLVNQATNDGIYDWDVKNDVFTWGDGFYRNFGYKKSKETFKLKNWVNLMHPIDAEKNKAAWNEFLADKQQTKWTKKFRFRKADGRYAFVLEIGILNRDEHGQPQRMIGVLRDQTEIYFKEVKEETERKLGMLFKSEARLTDILHDTLRFLADITNCITAEIWIKDQNKDQLKLNSTIFANTSGQKFFSLSNKASKAVINEGYPGVIWKTGKAQVWSNVQDDEKFYRRNAAKEAGIDSFIGIPLTHNKDFIGVLLLGGMKDNIHEENTNVILQFLEHFLGSEIRRKRQEEELYHLFQSAPDIIAIAAKNGYFTKVNPAFSNLLGYTSEELTKKPFESFLHPEDLNRTEQEYQETISGERQANNFINRYRTKKGTYKWISWSSSATFGEDELVFAFGRDITEIKELQQLFDNVAKLARIGSWKIDIKNNLPGDVYWSSMTKEIFEVEQDFNPNMESGLSFYRDEERTVIETGMQNLIETGIGFDLELLMVTAKGNKRWIRCIGESEQDNEKVTRIYGSFQDIHHRKIAELELLKFKEIIESSKDGIVIVDRSGQVVYLNPGFTEMLGHTQDSISKLGGPESIYGDKENAKEVLSVIQSGNYWKGDVKLFNSDNQLSDFYLSGGPVFDDKGQLIAIYGILTDISERKRAEQNLQNAFEERNRILESIGDGFMATDSNMDITYWNKQAEIILGRTKEEVLGKNLFDIYHDAIDTEFHKQYNQALRTGETVHFEAYYTGLDLWMEVSVYPTEKGLSIFFKDVTTRKTADEQIRESNERFEKVSEATNDAIWDFDIIQDTLYWGPGFKTLFGYDFEKGLPTLDSWTTYIHDEDRESVLSTFKAVLDSHETLTWNMDYRFKKLSGDYAYINDRAIIIRNKTGKAVRAIGAMSDITYRKTTEESLKQLNADLQAHAKELESSNAELEQFAYVASHDLQEPLRMVTSFLSQLEKKYKEQLDERARQYIFYAVDGAKRMRQIILDLLQYSRVGRMEEEKKTIDLNALIDDYRTLRKSLIDEKSAQINTKLLPVIYSYKSPVTQIFHNLLDNALKYSREDVKVEIFIDFKDLGTYWEFSVQDNGIGIDSEYFEKIFIIFQRLHDKNEYSGTGLGLAIVKKIVESLHGKIHLESEIGKGTKFTFTIKK